MYANNIRTALIDTIKWSRPGPGQALSSLSRHHQCSGPAIEFYVYIPFIDLSIPMINSPVNLRQFFFKTIYLIPANLAINMESVNYLDPAQ